MRDTFYRSSLRNQLKNNMLVKPMLVDATFLLQAPLKELETLISELSTIISFDGPSHIHFVLKGTWDTLVKKIKIMDFVTKIILTFKIEVEIFMLNSSQPEQHTLAVDDWAIAETQLNLGDFAITRFISKSSSGPNEITEFPLNTHLIIVTQDKKIFKIEDQKSKYLQNESRFEYEHWEEEHKKWVPSARQWGSFKGDKKYLKSANDYFKRMFPETHLSDEETSERDVETDAPLTRRNVQVGRGGRGGMQVGGRGRGGRGGESLSYRSSHTELQDEQDYFRVLFGYDPSDSTRSLSKYSLTQLYLMNAEDDVAFTRCTIEGLTSVSKDFKEMHGRTRLKTINEKKGDGLVATMDIEADTLVAEMVMPLKIGEERKEEHETAARRKMSKEIQDDDVICVTKGNIILFDNAFLLNYEDFESRNMITGNERRLEPRWYYMNNSNTCILPNVRCVFKEEYCYWKTMRKVIEGEELTWNYNQ